jgi:hypothetical protein
MTNNPEPRVQLVFRDMPAPTGHEPNEPLSLRVRRLLKIAGRALRLRCEAVEWLPPAKEEGGPTCR